MILAIIMNSAATCWILLDQVSKKLDRPMKSKGCTGCPWVLQCICKNHVCFFAASYYILPEKQNDQFLQPRSQLRQQKHQNSEIDPFTEVPMKKRRPLAVGALYTALGVRDASGLHFWQLSRC